jgi:hypothetical protein
MATESMMMITLLLKVASSCYGRVMILTATGS